MKRLKYALLCCLLAWLGGMGWTHIDRPNITITEDASVYELLQKLGDAPANHTVKTDVANVSAESGESLIKNGFSLQANGNRKGGKQSKFFVCTSCHNIQREDADLSVSNPESRLEYVKEKQLPLLQATTLWGAVNRETFYNGDYIKKYGDLVAAAKHDMRKAIQLCATECAQGRPLAEWEVESILAYLWTLDMKMSDLGFSDSELASLNQDVQSAEAHPELIKTIKSKYLQGSPATFHDAPEDRKEGFAYEGRPEKGKDVYDLSCMHCHENGRYSFFELDDSKNTFRFLKKHFVKYTRYSTYHVTAYGAPSRPGKRAYMPHFPKEKLSKQQIEDLRAYFESRL